MASDMNNPIGTQPPDKPQYAATPDDRTWGLLAHLSALIAIWLGGLSFLGPLLVWLIKKDQSPFVADQSKEALNFQLAVFIVTMICTITCVGLILVPVIFVADIVYSVLAGVEANKGVYYRYPYTFRLIA